MPPLKRHIARLKQIRELSSIKKRKYSNTEILEYQNEVSSDKLKEDSILEISEEELEMTDDDEEDLDEDALLMLMKAAQTSKSFEQFKAPYSRGSEYSKRSICRHNQEKKTLAESAKWCIPLTANFLSVKKNINIGKSQSLQSSQTISGLGSETQDLKATQE